MTRKKATIILEGNEVAVQQAIHELNKLKSEANRQPELTATLQSESLPETNEYDLAFQSAAEQD